MSCRGVCEHYCLSWKLGYPMKGNGGVELEHELLAWVDLDGSFLPTLSSPTPPCVSFLRRAAVCRRSDLVGADRGAVSSS